MNRIYRLIWSNAHQCFVTVSEISKSRGKGSSNSLVQKSLDRFEVKASALNQSITTLFRRKIIHAALGLSIGLFNFYGGNAIAACVTASGNMTCSGNVGTASDTFGLELSSSIGTLTNNDTILGHQSGMFNQQGKTTTTFNNIGILSSNRVALENWGSFGTINNSGSITIVTPYWSGQTLLGVYHSRGTIGLFNNTGTISNADIGIQNSEGGVITELRNAGSITSTKAIENNTTITTINNSGSILGGLVSQGWGIQNYGTIGTLSNSASGLIQGYYLALENFGSIGSIVNSGQMIGVNQGIFNQGGTTINSITNNASGVISDFDSIINIGTIGSISNSGSISGGDRGAIYNQQGGTIGSNGNIGVTNTSTGIISGTIGIGNDSTMNGIANSGAITGSSMAIKNGGTLTTINNSGSLVGGLTDAGGKGVENNGTIGTLNNNGGGLMKGFWSGLGNNGSITTINNSGTMIGTFQGIENTTASIGVITNNAGGILTATNTDHPDWGGAGIWSYASINAISNSGTIGSISGGTSSLTGIWNYGSGASIGSSSDSTSGITNNVGGTISGTENGIRNTDGNTYTGGGSIYRISNAGTISGGNVGINNGGTITNITNTGSISGSVAGIHNTGTITSITNSGAGSISSVVNGGSIGTYSGTLPSIYKILINGSDAGQYGQISFGTVSSTMSFGIASNSTIAETTYLNVLSGIASNKLTSLSGSVSGTSYTWQLRPESTPNYWDLVVSTGISSVSSSQTITANDLSGSNTVALAGGKITASATSGTITNPLAINSASVIDTQNGAKLVISGELSGASKLSISNSTGTGGVVVLAANNSNFSGGLSVSAGANVQVSSASALGTGSLELVGSSTTPAVLTTTADMTISNPISVSGDPVFNVAPTTTTTISAPITDGNSSGDVVVSGGGTLNLTAVNTYTGPTTIDAGSTLALSGSGSIAQSSGVANSGTFDISATTNGATVKAISGSGAVALGSKNLTVSNASGSFSGSIAGTGGINITGGSQTLSGINTYTGSTSVSSGATLALSGSGSIATSSGVTNNGTFNVTGKTGNVSVASYTQSSTGNLAMGYSPTSNQKLLVAGVASLAGGLTLTASSGTYQSGKYALLSAGSVSGTFGALSSNLSSLTRLSYNLAYDASNVYLVFTPNTADTQQSLVNTASALQNIYTLQNSVLANSFSYDCSEFGANNICLSVGGRNTAVQAANGLNNTSGLLIAAYRPHPNYRIGAYADQNLSVSNPGGTVNLGNNTPLIGVFGAWNQNLDGTGTEIKVSAAYGQKNATMTRSVVGTSEAGTGSSQLSSQGAQVTAKYGFAMTEKTIVSPYIGVRYTQNNMGGYTEATSATVTAPLTYSALNTNATTALAGLGASYKLTPVVTTFASAGVETDTNTANGTYSATGITGLTPINFNANPVKTRPTATLGAYYDVAKNQRLGITGIYRQEPYQAVSTTTVMATYTIGL